jgi:hypothetical protein
VPRRVTANAVGLLGIHFRRLKQQRRTPARGLLASTPPKENPTMSYRLPLTVVCALLLAPTLQGADKPTKPSELTAERVRLVRQMYAKLPCEILGLAEPVKLAGVGYSFSDKWEARVRDVVLKDAKGKKLPILLGSWGDEGGKSADSVYLDREQLPRSPEETAALSGWQLFEREQLPRRSPEEAAVYGLLLRLPKEDREAEGVAELLNVLDWRFAGAMRGKASK